MNNTFFIK